MQQVPQRLCSRLEQQQHHRSKELLGLELELVFHSMLMELEQPSVLEPSE